MRVGGYRRVLGGLSLLTQTPPRWLASSLAGRRAPRRVLGARQLRPDAPLPVLILSPGGGASQFRESSSALGRAPLVLGY